MEPLGEGRAFRFGVSVRSPTSRREWQEGARRAEALGYSTLLVPDHLAAIAPPFLPLLTAAEATSTLRVGTFVLNNDFRHPAFVAREAATLDLLSEGRFELGIGAGHMRSEYEQIGLRFDPGQARVERLSEAVSIVKGLLDDEELTWSGRHYRLAEHRVFPPGPHQVPILIGGNGRGLLELAAREADIVGLIGFSHRRGGTAVDMRSFSEAGASERLAIVRRAAGPRFAELELNALVQRVIVTDDPKPCARQIADDLELSVEDALSSPFLLIGTHGAIAERLEELRERLGFSYIVVPETAFEDFAPVVARLA